MGEEVSQGITRRDLLRRGVVLGGAVVWTTPVVQTLGMGRAFAQTASPVGGKEVSYAVISWKCNGSTLKVKWDPEKGGDGFALDGNLPDCGEVGGSYASAVPNGLEVRIDPNNSACIRVDVPAASEFGCSGTVSEVRAWVKAGSKQSTVEPCQSENLVLDKDNQPACSALA